MINKLKVIIDGKEYPFEILNDIKIIAEMEEIITTQPEPQYLELHLTINFEGTNIKVFSNSYSLIKEKEIILEEYYFWLDYLDNLS